MKYPTLACVSLAALGACGGRNDESGGDDPASTGSGGMADSGGSDSTSGGPTQDATGGSTNTGGDEDDPTERDLDAYVEIFNLHFGSNAHARVVSLAPSTSPPSMNECEIVRVGECVARRCPSTVPTDEDPELRPDLGTVEVSFQAMEGPMSATFNPDEWGEYETADLVPIGSLLGEEVGTVTASGGELGAFSLTVTMPLFLISSNALNEDSRIVAPRSAPLTLTWDRGVPGVQHILQQSYVPQVEGARMSFNCSFPSEAGQAVIDAAVLEFMPAGTTIQLFTAGVFYTPEGVPPSVRVRTIGPVVNPEKNAAVMIALQ